MQVPSPAFSPLARTFFALSFSPFVESARKPPTPSFSTPASIPSSQSTPTLVASWNATVTPIRNLPTTKSALCLSLLFPPITNSSTSFTRSSCTSAKVSAALTIHAAQSAPCPAFCHNQRCPQHDFDHFQPAPPTAPRRSRSHPALRGSLHVGFSRYSLRSTQLARKSNSLRRFFLHHRRIHRFSSNSLPYNFPSLGRTKPRATWRPLQNQNGRWRCRHLAPPSPLHVFRQLLATQSHPRALVSSPHRNRRRTEPRSSARNVACRA